MSETSDTSANPQGGAVAAATDRPSWLWNKDLAPVPPERRTWGAYNFAALWIAMSVNLPTYMLASGMIAAGMNWKQALLTVFLGNVIVLIPMLLNAHAGARYGIPFPVFARASFGVLGANIPALLRAVVACGWFAIQTWIGGQAINAMIAALVPDWEGYWLGLPLCFGFFWLLNVFVIVRGMETIRILHGVSAPFLLAVGLVMLGWAYRRAGGFGPMLAAPSKFTSAGEFAGAFVPWLTAVVAFWATVALNISDFTRYARSQRAQRIGQALGLPTTMTLFSFIGIAVTSATVAIFGRALWNPVDVLTHLGHPLAVLVALAAVLLATLNVNVAANLVSPANDFSNLYPRAISFRMGGILACLVGLVMQPWKLLESYGHYVNDWLVAYSAFLGPVAGVMIADYFVVRKKILLPEDLYQRGGFYEFTRGFNGRALGVLGVAIGVALMGRVVSGLRGLYVYAWFVGFGVAFLLYSLAMRRRPLSTGQD